MSTWFHHSQRLFQSPPVRTYGHTSGKGRFIFFEKGKWAGKTVRAELQELQHADRGRKFADVDRRALDPPPVVSLRLFEVIQIDHHCEEVEISTEEIETTGLLCAAELIPVIEPKEIQPARSPGSSSPDQFWIEPVFPNLLGSTQHSNMNDASLVYCGIEYTCPVSAAEILQLTNNRLIGSKVVQAQLIDLGGKKTLIFVFSDLVVRQMGQFRLHYKCFDLFSRIHGTQDVIIEDECYGGIFRIFASKAFPGLQESTALTKALSLQGVPLNIRYEKRKHQTVDEENGPDA
jgi:hypothetical protein